MIKIKTIIYRNSIFSESEISTPYEKTMKIQIKFLIELIN